MWRPLLVLAWAAAAAAQAPPSDPLDSFTAADLVMGKKLFVGHCAPCHGIDGTGGKGANLTAAKLKRARDDQAFFDIAREGIPGTIMDGAWQLSDGELWRIVAYARSLGKAAAAATLPGDPAAGKQAFSDLGCVSCHVVNGEGRAYGPELTTIGARRSAAYLREAIVNPGATVPEEYTMMLLKTKDRRLHDVMRLNEDTFTIQVKDAFNRISSYRKSDLLSCERQPGVSGMPSSPRVKPADLDNLVAYMATLRE